MTTPPRGSAAWFFSGGFCRKGRGRSTTLRSPVPFFVF